MKSFLASLLLITAAGFQVAAHAAPQQGVEYINTQQVMATENQAKVEVVELFWYGCPHCYHLDPQISGWAKKLPKDVDFKRIPGVFRPDWVPMAKAYYTLEALNLTEKLHANLFEAIHNQKVVKPTDEAGAIDWIAKQSGLDKKKVEDTFNSFSVNTKVSRAMQYSKASGATGVPAIFVDGKYYTSVKMATAALPEDTPPDRAHTELLKVTDFLIAKSAQEKSVKR